MPKKDEETKGFYKRGNIWWFSYTRDGVQFHQSTKCKNLKEAIIFKDKFFNTLKSLNNQKHLFDTIVLKFLDEKERILRPRTIEFYKLLIRNLIKFFSKKVINDITKIDLKNYEEYRRINGCSDGFLLKEFKLLKEIFNFAEEYELIDNNLFNRFNFSKKFKDYEARERYLIPEEIQRLLECCNYNLKKLVIFALETGMRIKEILTLCFIDIVTDPNTGIQFACIKKELSKNKKERFVPLSKLAMEQVNSQRLEFPNSSFVFTDSKGNYYKTTPKTAMNNAFKKANLKSTGDLFHILRHTFASLKLQGLTIDGQKVQPKSIEVISHVLGHSNINITMKVYAKFSKQSLLQIL